MKKIVLRIIAFILIQVFLFSGSQGIAVCGILPGQENPLTQTLSPRLSMDALVFQSVMAKIMERQSVEDRLSNLQAPEEDEAELHQAADENIVGQIIESLREKDNPKDVYRLIKWLNDFLIERRNVKLTSSQLMILIGIMVSAKDPWVRENTPETIAQALSNNMALLEVFLTEMDKCIATDSEAYFAKVLFCWNKKTINLKLTLKQCRMFIATMRRINNDLVMPTMAAVLSRVVADKPLLINTVISALSETLNTPKGLEFCDVLLKAFDLAGVSTRLIKQDKFDLLMSLLEQAQSPRVKAKILEILTKAMPNNRSLRVTPSQLESLIEQIKGLKISADNIKDVSGFFTELFLNDNTLIAQTMKAVKDSIARVYFVIALKNVSKRKPALVPMELIEEVLNGVNLNVVGVFISNSGSAPSLISHFAEILFNSIGNFPLKSPQDFPKLRKRARAAEISRLSLPFALDETNLHNIFILGRTIVIRDNDEFYALKLKKEKETAGELYYEHEVMSWVKEKKDKKELDLQNDYAQPVFIDGNRLLSIDAAQVPEEIRQRLQDVASADTKYRISEENGKYEFICYKIGKEGYFRYLNNPEIGDKKFKDSSLNIMHDLAQFARVGVLDTALVDIFHTLENTRRYLWMVDLLFPVAGTVFSRSGAGRLHAVSESLKHPNPREEGLADPAELRSIEGIIRNNVMGVGPHVSKDKKQLLASILGDYLLSWTLIYATRLKAKGVLNEDSWKNEALITEMAQEISSVFDATYDSFVPAAMQRQRVSRHVNWQMLARQIAFFIGGGYKKFVAANNIPKGIFPEGIALKSANATNLFDGFGFVDIRLFPENVPDEIRDYVINKYFFRHKSWDLAANIYKISQDPKLESRIKKDARIPLEYKKAVLSFIKEYRYGWRYNGRDEDLGPFNGPNPLTELIMALYLYSSFMVKEFSQEQAAAGKSAGHNSQVFGRRIQEVLGKPRDLYRMSAYPLPQELKDKIERAIEGKTTVRSRMIAVQKMLVAVPEQKDLYDALTHFMGHYETERELDAYLKRLTTGLHPDQKELVFRLAEPLVFEEKVRTAIEEQKRTRVNLNRGLDFYGFCLRNLKNTEKFTKCKGISAGKLFEAVLDMLVKKRGGCVWLDLACGKAGQLKEAKRIFENKLNIFGVDLVDWNNYDGKNLSTAITGAGEREGYHFLQDDIQNVKVPQKADIITMVYALPYLDNPLEALVNAYNHLKINGIFMANVQIRGFSNIRLKSDKRRLIDRFIEELRLAGVNARIIDDLLFIEKSDARLMRLNPDLKPYRVSYLDVQPGVDTGMKEVLYAMADVNADVLELLDVNAYFKIFADKSISLRRRVKAAEELLEKKLTEPKILSRMRQVCAQNRDNFLGDMLGLFLIRQNPSFFLQEEYKRMNKDRFLSMLGNRGITISGRINDFAGILDEIEKIKINYRQRNAEAWSYPYNCRHLSGVVMEELKKQGFRCFLEISRYPQDSRFFGYHAYIIIDLDGEEFLVDLSAAQFHKIDDDKFEETGTVIIPLREIRNNPESFYVYTKGTKGQIFGALQMDDRAYNGYELKILKRIMGKNVFYVPGESEEDMLQDEKYLEDVFSETGGGVSPVLSMEREVRMDYIFLPVGVLPPLSQSNTAARYYLSKSKQVEVDYYVNHVLAEDRYPLMDKIADFIVENKQRFSGRRIQEVVNEIYGFISGLIPETEGYDGVVSCALAKGLSQTGYKTGIYEIENFSNIRKHMFVTVTDSQGVEFIADMRVGGLLDVYSLTPAVYEMLYATGTVYVSDGVPTSLSGVTIQSIRQGKVEASAANSRTEMEDIISEAVRRGDAEFITDENGKYLQINYPGVGSEERFSFLSDRIKLFTDNETQPAYRICLKIGDFSRDGVRISMGAIVSLLSVEFDDLRVDKDTHTDWIYLRSKKEIGRLTDNIPSREYVFIEQAI